MFHMKYWVLKKKRQLTFTMHFGYPNICDIILLARLKQLIKQLETIAVNKILCVVLQSRKVLFTMHARFCVRETF